MHARYLARDGQRVLAWSLVELAGPHLPKSKRTELVTMLGAGDIEDALLDLVDLCTGAEVRVPATLVDPLYDWARGYRGTVLEATLRARIGSLLPNDWLATRENKARRPAACAPTVNHP